jgi:hypothetical protein
MAIGIKRNKKTQDLKCDISIIYLLVLIRQSSKLDLIFHAYASLLHGKSRFVVIRLLD